VSTVIDEIVALFRIRPDPDGAAAANGMLNGLINRTEQLRQYQDRLAATFAVAGAAVAYSWWQANTEYESLRNSLDLVTGSAEATGRAMQFLEQFATRSPDQLNQLTAAYQMLLAQGLDPTEERMIALGDTAAAVQTDMASLVDALAGGVIGNTERLDQAFGRFGYNFSSRNGVLSVQIGETSRVIGDSFAEIAAFAEELGRTEFAGGMERQARTMSGGLSMVQDAWSQLMIAIGDGGLREEVQALALSLADVIGEAQPLGRELGQFLLMGVRMLTTGMTLLAENGDEVRLALLGIAALGQGAVFVGLINALRQIGIVGAIIGAEAVAVPLAVGLMVGAAVLLIEDMYTYLKGGKSVIGDFVDSFANNSGPEGAIARFFMDIKEYGGEALGLLLQDIRGIWAETTAWTTAFAGGISTVMARAAELKEMLMGLIPEEVRWLLERAGQIGSAVMNASPAGAVINSGRAALGAGRYVFSGQAGGDLADLIMAGGDVNRNQRRVNERGDEIGNPAWWGMAPSVAPAFVPAVQAATAAPKGRDVRIQGMTVNIEVPATITSQEGMTEYFRTIMPDLIADTFRLSAERAEAELE
jgi:hypothetical protein